MSKTSINLGHEMLPGVSYPEWVTSDAMLWKMRNWDTFRVAMSDYTNTNAITMQKLYIKRVREIFPSSTVIWGIGKKGNKWRSSRRAEYKAKIIETAHYCQDNNLWCQQFNEDTNYWGIDSEVIVNSTKVGSVITVDTGAVKHGFVAGDKVTISGIGALMTIGASSETVATIVDDYHFTFNPIHPGTDGTTSGGTAMPNPSLVRDWHIALAAELRGTEGITVPLIGSVGQGGLNVWPSGDTNGNLTIAFNVYGEGANVAARLQNFKDQVDTFITIPQPTGALKMVTEYGCHSSFGSYPPVYADQVADLKAKREYAEAHCDKAFFFCWRSNSWSGSQNDNFAMRLTWSTSFAPTNIRWTEVFD